MKKLTLIATSVALGLTACSPAEKASQTQQEQQAQATEAQSGQAHKLHSGIDHSAMNTEIRPENDLYRYVSGHWLATTEIPGDKSRYGVFNMLHDNTQEQLKVLIQEAADMEAEDGSNNQKLGDMYNSYMDEETVNKLGIAPIEKDIADIAGLDSHKDVARKMGELFALGVQQPFGFYVYPDAKNPNVYGMWLYQSGLSLPDRDYYFKEEAKFEKFRSALTDYVADMLAATGHDNPADAAKAVVALEKRIAEKHLSRVESRDAEKNYNKRSTEQVKALLDGFDWQSYADASGLAAVDEMIVRQLPYFEAMGELFSNTDVAVWKDYLTFKMVDTYAPRLHQELVDRHFDFHSKTLNGIPEQRPRWKRAVSATSGVLGEVLGQQYVARHFKPEAKAKMEELVNNLILAYEQSIKELDWMTEETKQAALEKLSKFNPKIGYPDEWRDYSALTISDDDLVGNYKRYNRFEQDYQVGRIGQPVKPVDWGMTPQTVNAYYSPTRNEIVFPAAILQPPFFDLNAEDAVNYGAIGAVIGHEIGHGFDDQGSKYDGDGNLRSWWTEQDREAFDALGAKLAAQFDQYEPLEGQTINGKLTLGENIGDLAGLTIAHKAYELALGDKPAPEIDGLTGDQRFFMGWAQVWRNKMREDALRAKLISGPHSPGEYRVNGTVINIDSFYDAFDVKPGDDMYLPPEERVKIW